MGWILFLIVLIIFILFVLFVIKVNTFKFGIAPNTIEIKPIRGLKKLSDILDESLSKSFMENIEERVRNKHKLKENEYEWRLLDLKRYFIMTYILKESPMFSEKVDELWHEMLMFTREYDKFSGNYLGTKLHHSPNVNSEPEPDLRSFFDWVYAELFFIRKENIHLYNGFFRNPVNPKIIEEFKNLSEDELMPLYFKHDIKHTNTILALITSMKKTVNLIKDHDKSTIRGRMRKAKSHQNYNAMLVPVLSVSYFHFDEFTSYLEINNYSSSNCTSCGSASYYNSCSSNSSCSSGSCSSCGGGGN